MANPTTYLAFKFRSEEARNKACEETERKYSDLKVKKGNNTFPILYIEDKRSLNFNLTLMSLVKKFDGELIGR